jgi:hypothetical protein
MLCTGEAESAEPKKRNVDSRKYKSVSIKLFLYTVFGKRAVSSNAYSVDDFNSVFFRRALLSYNYVS